MMQRSARGYSYLEVLLVVAMTSVLVALVLPTARTMNRRAKEKELARGLATIRAAIDAYHRDWERGCVESAADDLGWPKNLEELADGVEWSDLPHCQPTQDAASAPTAPPERRPKARGRLAKKEPDKKIYLPRPPRDPFNRAGDEWDTMGWKARSYEDDFDSTTWSDEGLYDVYSSSELHALDGTSYSEW